MVARRPTALLNLFNESATKHEALTTLRNCIIGNKAAKASFVAAGVVPLIIELLAGYSSSTILLPEDAAASKLFVDGAVTFGSLACSNCLTSSDLHAGFSHLVGMLCSTQTFVVEGATRALKLVLQVGRA